MQINSRLALCILPPSSLAKARPPRKAPEGSHDNGARCPMSARRRRYHGVRGALALQTQMQTARTLIDTRCAEQTTSPQLRDAEMDALFEELSETIGERDDLLEDTDPRWEVFGLKIPANPNPSGCIATLTADGPGPASPMVSKVVGS